MYVKRWRREERKRKRKGREFIPVKMALTGDAKLLFGNFHVVEVADVSNNHDDDHDHGD